MKIVDLLMHFGIDMIDKGEYYAGKCPFHEDTSPSFVVYKTGDRFHCFGCGKRGDALDLVMHIKNLNFTKAVKYLGIEHQISQVLLPYPPLIDQIVEEEKQGKPVREMYKELLIAMGWMKED